MPSTFGTASSSCRVLSSQLPRTKRTLPCQAVYRFFPSRCASTSSASSPLDTDDADGMRSKRMNPAPGPPKPNSPFTIFDRHAKVLQKSRAALQRSHEPTAHGRGQPGSASRTTDYVRTAVAQSLAERILDIKREFGTIVELGSGPGYLRHHLQKEETGIKKIVMCDSSREILHRDQHLDPDFPCELVLL